MVGIVLNLSKGRHAVNKLKLRKKLFVRIIDANRTWIEVKLDWPQQIQR